MPDDRTNYDNWHEDEDQYIDHLICEPWRTSKNLCDNTSIIPHERIMEALKEIDDAIQLLNLARLGLEGRKQ